MAIAIDEDVALLPEGRRGGLQQLKEETYPFQVSVDGPVRVKIAETLGNIQQLGKMMLSAPVKCRRKGTHKADPVRVWIPLHKVHQSSVRHPLRDDLQRIRRDPDGGDDIWVLKLFPHNCLFDERLLPLRASLSRRELIVFHAEHEPYELDRR